MTLFIFAGEASGDLYGEGLLKALHELHPNLKVYGIGGPKMRATGMECLLPMEAFQVMGFVDVMLSFPRLFRQFYAVRDTILKLNPKVVLTIDYPGFSLRLARALSKKGFKGKVCHYICPSVWAWGKERIDTMATYLDDLLTILPFEKPLFAATSLPVTYVGHPLVHNIPSILPPSPQKRIALFPGSRKKEIERNLPLQLKVASSLLQEHPNYHCAISITDPSFLPLVPKNIVVLPKEELMQTASLAIAKSGTVTLELALHGIPTVVTYALSPIDLLLAKYLFRIRLPYYCLVNIVAGRPIFPELIGSALTETALYLQAKKFITDPDSAALCREGCAQVRRLLGSQDANKSAAQLLLSHLLR